MNHTLNSTITLALTIAEHAYDAGLPCPAVTYPATSTDLIANAIKEAIRGSFSCPSPSQWACIVDAQEACRLLTKSQSFGPDNHYQQTTYLDLANRKLAEAVSWLM